MLFLISTIRHFFFYCASIFCRIVLMIFWKKVDVLPKNIDKGVILLAPHTSSWDGFWGIFYTLAFFNYNRNILMAFRQESNTPFVGSILRFFGAVFIDRRKLNKNDNKPSGMNAINFFVKKLNKYQRVYLGIFAEGTRNPVEHFNPGFYYIAYKAKVPILTLKFDYGNSALEAGPIIMPCGSYKKDLSIWKTFFKDSKGKKAENFKLCNT